MKEKEQPLEAEQDRERLINDKMSSIGNKDFGIKLWTGAIW